MGVPRSGRLRRVAVIAEAWPQHALDGSRIVVECGDFALSGAVAGVLRREGYHVAVCAGPDDRHRCPLQDGSPCELAEHSQLVINLFGLSDSDRAEVLALLRARYPDIPVLVDIAGPVPEEAAEALEGVRVFESPLRGASLVAEVAGYEADGAFDPIPPS